jgi:hypothetical protein
MELPLLVLLFCLQIIDNRIFTWAENGGGRDPRRVGNQLSMRTEVSAMRLTAGLVKRKRLSIAERSQIQHRVGTCSARPEAPVISQANHSAR